MSPASAGGAVAIVAAALELNDGTMTARDLIAVIHEEAGESDPLTVTATVAVFAAALVRNVAILQGRAPLQVLQSFAASFVELEAPGDDA
jgi:hypothetical protein